MKDQLSIIIAVAVFAYAGVRIYQKYFKKDNPGNKPGISTKKSTGFPSSSDKNDYEPYSKK